MNYETILTDIRDGLGIITINRPESRNALSRTVLAEIAAALEAFRGNPDVGVVVFTGAGEKAFVAGADINQLAGYTMLDGLSAAMATLYDSIESYESPPLRPSMASPWAAATNWLCPATSASPPPTPASDCLKRTWAYCPGPAARSGCPGW